MKKYHNFSDPRQHNWCAFCGGGTETKDHVPSKIFLNKPYPENLPSVLACEKCNLGFSKDEEYIACWLGIASADINGQLRDKVATTLKARPALKNRIVDEAGDLKALENNRMANVIYKLAAGHSLYELNEPQFTQPSSITFKLISSLAPHEIKAFETTPNVNVLPEIGSQQFHKVVLNGANYWQVVQENAYRYLAVVTNGILVRIVINETIACEAVWE